MSQWGSQRARRVLAALLRIGWQLKRQSGSHCTLAREGSLVRDGQTMCLHSTTRMRSDRRCSRELRRRPA
ncbi:MAG: type II toxin-antitoxin system HicA family toxin [Phycisphaeraceae bacterium]|nr:type II toxin-antitoxin system HicA family toxin [Phycisphaeraceae bacterium]